MLRTLLNGLGAIGNVLDLPGSSVRDVLAGQNPFDQYLTPLHDTNRTSGRDLLRSYGMVGDQDTWGNFAGGMAAETLLDPTNLIGGSYLKNAFKRIGAAKTANRGINAANAMSLQQRAMGYMPEEIAKLTKIVDPATGLPKRVYHGTRAVYDQFDPAKADPNALYGAGYYTTDAPRVASSYTTKGGPVAEEQWGFKPESRDAVMNAYANIEDYADPEHAWNSLNRMVYTNGPQSDMASLLDDEIPGGVQQHIARTGMTVHAPGNVRMSYIDARKPFNIDSEYTAADFPSVAEKLPEPTIKAPYGLGLKTSKVTRDDIEKIMSFHKENPSEYGDMIVRKMEPLLSQFPEQPPPPPIPGSKIMQAIQARGLKSHGYDAITHKGGQLVGGLGDHNVTIALDPSQIYKPYIAPALQDLKKVPKTPKGAIGALVMQNLLKQQRERSQ